MLKEECLYHLLLLVISQLYIPFHPVLTCPLDSVQSSIGTAIGGNQVDRLDKDWRNNQQEQQQKQAKKSMYKTVSHQKGFNLIVPFMERKVALDFTSQHLPPSKK